MQKNGKFIIITVIFVLCITFCITATVKAQEKKLGTMESEYLTELEKQYRRELKDILRANGYDNAGITMTKTMEEDRISYNIKINHKKLRLHSAENRNILQQEINRISMDLEAIEYQYEFL